MQLSVMTDAKIFATKMAETLYEEAMGIIQTRNKLEKEHPETAKHIFDVTYSDLMKDPEAEIRKIYDHFGYEFTEEYQQRIAAYLEMDSHKTRNPIRVTAQSFQLDPTEIDSQFQPYTQQCSKFF